MVEARGRRAWADVDVAAIRHNAAVLKAHVGSAALCAVVKADGYGHGAVAAARAALDGGATWLAVAVVDEGAELRGAGIDAPVLLLSEPHPSAVADAVHHHLALTLYTAAGVAAAEAAAAGRSRRVPVHLKVDTGMRRVGAPPDAVASLARAVASSRHLALAGLWTHFAVADDPALAHETAAQVARFEEARDGLWRLGIVPDLLHVSNSAGALAHPAFHYDMVRAGISLYGYPPSPALAGIVDLRPALRLTAEVSFVKTVSPGDRMSYGLTYAASSACTVATVPLGYADGVRRALGRCGGEVLVAGRRRPIAGTVTMDQILVDCGPGAEVAVGDEVVLLGRQGDDEIGAQEWADRLDTITYEVLCGIGPRVPRRHTGGDGQPVQARLGLS